MTDPFTCAPAEKTLAWGGLSLAVPDDWEPGLLDSRALRVDRRSGPALELKWSRISSFDPARQIDKVARSFKSVRFIRRGEPGLPPDWKRAVKDRRAKNVQAEPFAWTDESTGQRALGAAIHFRRSGTAALLQCFLAPGDESCELPMRILASLADHGADDFVPFAVFGLRAEVPARFELTSHSFQPGHFRLSFRAKKSGLFPLGKPAELVLERFGPASVLLGHRDDAEALSLWASKQYKNPLPGQRSGEPVPESGGEPEGEPGALVFTGRRARREIRLAHGANKILVLTLTRARQRDLDDMEHVSRNHGTA